MPNTNAGGGTGTIGTDNPNPQNPPNSPNILATGQPDAKWLLGYMGLWFSLAVLSDVPSTQEFAAVLGASIAIGATFVLLPKAISKFQGK